MTGNETIQPFQSHSTSPLRKTRIPFVIHFRAPVVQDMAHTTNGPIAQTQHRLWVQFVVKTTYRNVINIQLYTDYTFDASIQALTSKNISSLPSNIEFLQSFPFHHLFKQLLQFSGNGGQNTGTSPQRVVHTLGHPHTLHVTHPLPKVWATEDEWQFTILHQLRTEETTCTSGETASPAALKNC